MDTNELFTAASLDGRRTKAAIFSLEHKPSGRRLILSTKNLSKRLYDQRHLLGLGKHHNAEVQADLIADGPEAFRLVVLDLVSDPSTLPLLKRLHVEHARSQNLCYNAPEPPSRKGLSVQPRVTSTVNGDAESKAPLDAALERLGRVTLPEFPSLERLTEIMLKWQSRSVSQTIPLYPIDDKT